MRCPHPVELAVPFEQPGQIDPGPPDIAVIHPLSLQPKSDVGEHLVSLGRGVPGQLPSGLRAANGCKVEHPESAAGPQPSRTRRRMRDGGHPGLAVARDDAPDLQADKVAVLQRRALYPSDRHAQVQFLPPVSRLALLQHSGSGGRKPIKLLLDRLNASVGHRGGHLGQQFVSTVLLPSNRSRHMVFSEGLPLGCTHLDAGAWLGCLSLPSRRRTEAEHRLAMDRQWLGIRRRRRASCWLGVFHDKSIAQRNPASSDQ